MDSSISKAICLTEEKIRQCESHFPPNGGAKNEWLMWLPRSHFPKDENKSLSFRPVLSEADWEKMLRLRIDIEKNFGITDIKIISGFVSDIKAKSRELGGKWFLAIHEGQIVGEVGLIEFEIEGLKIARLQDVDIMPTQQGRGFGRHLLHGICEIAARSEIDGLALFARTDSWVKDWYLRFGFIKVGEASKT